MTRASWLTDSSSTISTHRTAAVAFPLAALFALAVLAVALALVLGGCSSTEAGRMVPAEALGPMAKRVVDRHDAYVLADPTLDALQRSIFLDSSALLMKALGVEHDRPRTD
jgi:hypothetical protein